MYVLFCGRAKQVRHFGFNVWKSEIYVPMLLASEQDTYRSIVSLVARTWYYVMWEEFGVSHF